ncbi:hypothetical protein E2C01_068256 [Portunus trituberculatus]|uniref:Uncharacterized protein n=1 Tax=Portunus trituberculatus TaxID=210409 RepID=A0A5B7HZJ6_PORTR|nr:hypothetical protein [Portunus trituberculatus]
MEAQEIVMISENNSRENETRRNIPVLWLRPGGEKKFSHVLKLLEALDTLTSEAVKGIAREKNAISPGLADRMHCTTGDAGRDTLAKYGTPAPGN